MADASKSIPPKSSPAPEPDVSSAAETSQTPPPGDANASTMPTRMQTPADLAAAMLGPCQASGDLGSIGGYRILRVIGEGGMAIVYEAEDSQLKRRVALKLMKPLIAAEPEAHARFFREAQSAAALRNDHIVAIHQVGEERGVPFLVMPLLEGESLHARLKREPLLPLPEMLRIARETAQGLAAAHSKGLVHRDIKPGNLWLESPNERVLILDFGLARPQEGGSQHTGTGVIVGTPMYMAPEQAHGKPVDSRADLFSLGCVLYELTTGKLPFTGESNLEVLINVGTVTPPSPHEVDPSLPAALSDLVMWLLAKEPSARPKSAAAVIDELKSIETAGFEANRNDAAQPPIQSWLTVDRLKPPLKPTRYSRPALLAGFAAVILVFSGIGYGIWKSQNSTEIASTGTHNSVQPVVNPPKTEPPVDGVKPPPPVEEAKSEPLSPPPKTESKAERPKQPPQSPPTTTPAIENQPATEPTLTVQLGGDVKLELVRIPKGTFWMGSPASEPNRDKDEDQKQVTINGDFYLGKFEVTQEQWQQLMGKNPSEFSRTGGYQGKVSDLADSELKRFPVESISWTDAQVFIRKLNELPSARRKGFTYRLPTEREWEYACRGGSGAGDDRNTAAFGLEQPSNLISSQHANFDGNQSYGGAPAGRYLERPLAVGAYKPNALGLFDMHGNVWEWCDDTDDASAVRIARGGSWTSSGQDCRAAARGKFTRSTRSSFVGLRVALVPASE